MNTKPHPSAPTPDRVGRTAPHLPAGGTRVPQKWRWHYRVLRNLRVSFLEEVREALSRTAGPADARDKDPADCATGESDRLLALRLLSGEQDARHAVDAAIRRILSGSYGVCERTGKRISTQRLRAIPWTRYTMEAQEAIEKDARSQHDGTASPDSRDTGRRQIGTRGTSPAQRFGNG